MEKFAGNVPYGACVDEPAGERSSCPGPVILVDELEATPEEFRYVFRLGGDEVEGYISHQDNRYGIRAWLPFIRSSTRSGYWNAGDTLEFQVGYPDRYEAFAALLGEAQTVLAGEAHE